MDSLALPATRRNENPTDNLQPDIARRRPTIPHGIVTARLGQLKTLTDDNGSVIRHATGESSLQGCDHRVGGGFVIPASRSTIFDHATLRSRLDSNVSRLADQAVEKTEAGYLQPNPSPRASKSFDNILCNRTSPGQQSRTHSTAHDHVPKMAPISMNKRQQTAAMRYQSGWMHGDGVQDGYTGAHICHSCGEWITSQKPCLSCGHAFCSRCTADIENDSNESQAQVGTSATTSSTAASQQPEKQTDHERGDANPDDYQWGNESRKHTTSVSSSSRSIPRAKTLPSLYQNQPARHCICCIGRQPITRRQTMAVPPNTLQETFSSSRSGSSTATHATTISRLRLRESSDDEEALLPAALQPRRTTPRAQESPPKTRVSDPYAGRRLLRPHPHEPEPETESWPRLRQIPEVPDSQLNDEGEDVPWRRDNLRKVSRPAAGEPRVYEKPKMNPEWVARLRKVNEPSGNARAINEAPLQPQTSSSPLDRSKQDCVYCDRNRSESMKPSERPVLSINNEPLAQSVQSRTPTKSPSLAARSSRSSLRQVESLLGRNLPGDDCRGQDEMDGPGRQKSAALNRNRATSLPPRGGKPSGIMKSPTRGKSRDQHSCLWRDRFMDLSAEVDQLRSELDSCEPSEVNSPDTVQEEHDCDDAGIDGLTVVIHLKGRDDLVINTDLRTA